MLCRITLLAALTSLSACALAPDQAEPRWTDALLETAPPASAPQSVSAAPLAADVREDLSAHAADLQQRGAIVRRTGLALRAPTPDTAQFVVQARERGRPPEPQ